MKLVHLTTLHDIYLNQEMLNPSNVRGMAGKFVDTIGIFNRKRNSVKMNISGFAKYFMSIQTKFYENLANTTSSTAFYVHLPNRERGKGQRASDVT